MRKVAIAIAAFLTLGAAPIQDVHAPNSPLEAALLAAVHDPTARRTFEHQFLNSRVFLRITEESQQALAANMRPDGTLGAKVPVQVWIVNDADTGAQTLPLFTSLEAYQRVYPEHPYVSLDGRHAVGLPGRPVNVRVTDGREHRVTFTASELPAVIARNPPTP